MAVTVENGRAYVAAFSNEFRGRRSTDFRKIVRAAEIRKDFSVGRADL